MGCGGSKLKGDGPEEAVGASAVPPQPVKKVTTNFSNVDYTNSATNHKPSMAAAPDEIRVPTTSKAEDEAHAKLEPYRSPEEVEAGQSIQKSAGDGDGLGQTEETADMIR